MMWASEATVAASWFCTGFLNGAQLSCSEPVAVAHLAAQGDVHNTGCLLVL